jgi:glycosyltransferase involved in cell wall biosynthesis
MLLSLCVIAYNEERYITGILNDIKKQDYDPSKLEVVLVDSASTDGTRMVMKGFARENPQFRRVVVLDNPGRTLPRGWNVALAEYRGDAILKVDAHARIPADFVSANVSVLESGEDIAGGERPTVLEEDTPWQQTLLLAENSMFGSSIAPYRRNPGRRYVNSMFHAAYRREVFGRVGGFNEDLGRTEDNEIHYRMRQAGFKLCFDPDIHSEQYIRGSLKAMLRQKYSNGYWIGLTTGVCPQCLSLYHFVPFAFVMAIILSTLLCVMFTVFGAYAPMGGLSIGVAPWFEVLAGVVAFATKLMWGLYWGLALLMSILAVATAGRGKRNITCVALPILFFLLHVSYGLGTLAGFVRLPLFLNEIRSKRLDVR